jgi:hypothetical protein
MNTEDSRTMVEPMIKDITELCDFCIEFTKLIVQHPEDLGTTGDQFHSNEKLAPGDGLESCQLCDLISRIRPTTSDEPPTSLIQEGLYWRYPSTERPARICVITIRGKQFRIWADIGKKPRSCYIGLR